MQLPIRFTTLLLFIFTCCSAQQTKLSYELTRLSLSESQASKVISILIQGDAAQVRSAVEQCGGYYRYHIGLISSVTVKAGALRKLSDLPAITRIEQGNIHLHPLNDTMVYLNNVVEAHNGLFPLTQSYDGSGVVCGFIDTGIDFTHGDFRDSLGKSRVRFLWDQAMPVAPNTPQPFNYGQEWTNQDINNGICTETDTLNFGHGTRVAGTAAGNGLAVHRYEGVAPKADIIMVAVDFNNGGPTIADGAEYIFSKAQSMGKPCVINCSLGSEMGSHDGTDLETQVIDSLLNMQAGRVFVAATGNSGNIPYHMSTTISADTSFTWMRFNANDTANGATTMNVQVFGDSAAMTRLSFAIGADQVNPAYSFRGKTSFQPIPSLLGQIISDSILNNGKRIAIIQSFEQKTGNVYSIQYTVIPDSTYYNFRIISAGTGSFDAWSFQFLLSGLPPPVVYPPMSKCKPPDYNKTIETGFQCSPHVISVANYVNKDCFTDVVDSVVCYPLDFTPRQLAPSSGHGPTRSGIQKPDIAATGDFVISSMVLALKQYFSNQQLAKGGQHVSGGGTSQASPVIAGIAALLLQQNPTWTHMQVKNRITCSAKADSYTGSALPDNKWGFGKADAFHALQGCFPLSINQSILPLGDLQIWPNPLDESATVSFPETRGISELRINDVLGREISRFLIKEGTKSLTLPRGNMVCGIYFLTLEQSGKKSETRKFAVH
jgi:subtilisin family serine protease